MAAESKPSHSWVSVGSTYAAVVAGKIAALVYYADEQRGEQAGPRDEGVPAQAGPAWYLVWVNEPHRHYQLSEPAPPPGTPAAELDKSALVALAEAGEAIDAKLGGAASGGAAPSGPNGR